MAKSKKHNDIIDNFPDIACDDFLAYNEHCFYEDVMERLFLFYEESVTEPEKDKKELTHMEKTVKSIMALAALCNQNDDKNSPSTHL